MTVLERAGIMRRLKVLLVAMMALAASLVATPAVLAQAGDSALECTVVLDRGVPTVTVSGDIGSKIIIERRAFGRHWWRGVVAPSAEPVEFVDGPLPRTSARVEYRVIAKDTKGTKLASAPCDVGEPDANFECKVIATDDGYFGRTIGGRPPISDNVVRRRVSPEAKTSWRLVHGFNGANWSDGSSPTGWAQYEVIHRVNGVPYYATTCDGGVRDLTCEPADDSYLVETEPVATHPVGSGRVSVRRTPDLLEHLLVEAPSGKLSWCGRRGHLSVVSVASNGRVIYTDDYMSVLYTLTVGENPAPRPISGRIYGPSLVVGDSDVYALGEDGLIAADIETARSRLIHDLDGGSASQELALGPNGGLYTVIGDDPGLVGQPLDNPNSLVRIEPVSGELRRIASLPNWWNLGEISVDEDGTVRYVHDDKYGVYEEVYPPGTTIE